MIDGFFEILFFIVLEYKCLKNILVNSIIKLLVRLS